MGKQIRWKILIPALLLQIVGTVIMLSIVLNFASTGIGGLASNYVRELSREYAASAQATIEHAMSVSEILKPSFINTAKYGGGRREETISNLSAILMENESIYAIYTVWEPNAFDRLDKHYISKPGSDENGRFNTYIYRNGSGYSMQSLSFNSAGNSDDFYMIPKARGLSSVIGPSLF